MKKNCIGELNEFAYFIICDFYFVCPKYKKLIKILVCLKSRLFRLTIYSSFIFNIRLRKLDVFHYKIFYLKLLMIDLIYLCSGSYKSYLCTYLSQSYGHNLAFATRKPPSILIFIPIKKWFNLFVFTH